MAVTIYHNPRCSKSRQTLALVIESGVAYSIVEYIQDAPDAATLLGIADKLGLPLADLLRRGENEFKEASDLPPLDDEEKLADWLAVHPLVLERPIVVDDESDKAIVGRPPKNVLGLLSK